MWETQELEKAARKRLIAELGRAEGEEKFGLYLVARKRLLEDVLEEIKAAEPALTDHGPRHVANVLQNAHLLLRDDALSAHEMYLLLLSILFHDVGNILGRDGHQLKIGAVYDHVRQPNASQRQEQLVLFQVVGAHCGEAPNKTRDTLQFLEPSHLDGRPVNLRHVAAILRLADELAEGVQRTSLFMQRIHGYPAASEIYHRYAAITHVLIDKRAERIALTYHPTIEASHDGSLQNDAALREILQFTYQRIRKLDVERRYNKHYCPYLAPFKELSAVFQFWLNGRPTDLGLRPLVLTDLIVPGDSQKEVPEYDPSYAIEGVIAKVRDALSKGPKEATT
jgi:hypothetical protein